MQTAKLSGLVYQFSGSSNASSAGDGELLSRFVATRDEAAFAELVRRYGSLVLAVCRRVTGNHHLAEDAFQAVFVVLATKAATVRPAAAVPAWLYSVAYRTALRARTMSDRRQRREAPVGRLPETAGREADATEAADLAAVLDEEIARLPEALRLAVVLCELEGCPRKAAAERLGVAEGTLSSRLASARKTLAARLRGRGVALSAAGLSVALGRQASASVAVDLAARAVSAATSPASTPAAVTALSQGVLRIMFAQKLKTVGLLAALAMGTLACAASAARPFEQPTKPQAMLRADTFAPAAPLPFLVKAEPKPLPQGPNKLLFYRAGHLTLIDPDGKNDKVISKDRDTIHPHGSLLSPDGKMIASLVPNPLPPDDGTSSAKKRTATLHVRGLDEKEPGTSLGVEGQIFAWSPEGTEIAVSDFEDGPPTADKGPPPVTSVVVNVRTKEKAKLKLPDSHVVTDWSRDGKYFLTTAMALTKDGPALRQYLMNRDGTEHAALNDAKTMSAFGRLSPDGKRVLCLRIQPPDKEKKALFGNRELIVIDVATKAATKVDEVPMNADVQGFCWSPDGKRIAYTWRQVHEGKPEDVIEKETESFLVVCDADGKNQKTIATEKGKGQWSITIGQVDWR